MIELATFLFLHTIFCGYRWPKSHRAAASSGPLSLSPALVGTILISEKDYIDHLVSGWKKHLAFVKYVTISETRLSGYVLQFYDENFSWS